MSDTGNVWTGWYSTSKDTQVRCRIGCVGFPLWVKDVPHLILDLEEPYRGDAKSCPNHPYVLQELSVSLHPHPHCEIILSHTETRELARQLRDRMYEIGVTVPQGWQVAPHPEHPGAAYVLAPPVRFHDPEWVAYRERHGFADTHLAIIADAGLRREYDTLAEAAEAVATVEAREADEDRERVATIAALDALRRCPSRNARPRRSHPCGQDTPENPPCTADALASKEGGTSLVQRTNCKDG